MTPKALIDQPDQSGTELQRELDHAATPDVESDVGVVGVVAVIGLHTAGSGPDVDVLMDEPIVEPMAESVAWLSTEEAAARVGMTAEWVRRQINAGRLRATVWETGARRTYRIQERDWVAFLGSYSHWAGGGPSR